MKKTSNTGEKILPRLGGTAMDLWLGIVLGIVAVLTILHIVLYLVVYVGHGVCKSNADLSGKTAIVTGANAGIGYYTALDLATRNARVILACRNRERGEEAVKKIREETGNGKVVLYLLDTSLMASVRSFVEEFKKNETRLDILINNAGISGGTELQKTSEGLELVMTTNHFGPFLLTNHLLDMLKSSSPSRIVNVSSLVHSRGKIDFEGLLGEKGRNSRVYSMSKLANVLFTRELAHRLQGTGVTANSLHPGAVFTDIFKRCSIPVWLYVKYIARCYFKTSEQGAQTSIYCAVSEEVEGVTGKYFSDCAVQNESERAKDDGVAKKLWEVSEKITGLTN